MNKNVSSADFVKAMGNHVSSVCVITTAFEGQSYGLTATAVSSVCADPPRILVCVNKSGVSYDKICLSQHFAVNVLAENQDAIAKAFAGMMGRDFNKFSVGQWENLETGSPCLKDTSASFDCRLVQTIDQFSHAIMIGEVVAVTSVAGQDTLLYGARRFRNLRKQVTIETSDEQESLHF